MAMMPVMQAEATPFQFERQMVGVVLERKQLSESHFTGIRKEFPQLYDLYRGVMTGRHTPHKNSVHVPLIFSTIQSDVARKTQTSFGAWPVVKFVGYGPDDAATAKKREALISAQMKDCNSFRKGYELFLNADLYGTAVAQIGWNFCEEDMLVLDVQAMPLTGRMVETSRKQRVTTFDGPDWKVLDCLDVFPQPNFREIEDMQWFITREYMDLDDIRTLALPNIHGKGVFDAARVRELEQNEGSYIVADDYKSWRLQGRTLYENDSRTREKYARPVELLTMWGTVPSEFAKDGITNRVMTVANGTHLLRNRPNPFWNAKKPFLAYSPMPDPHFFFATGKAEVAKKLQIVANRFTNQQLDALDIFIDPAFFYDQNSNLQTRNLLMRPGKFIPMDGNPAERVTPVIPNLQGVQMGSQMTEQVWRWMQQGSGIIEDTVQGAQGQRQTAREFLGRSEATATRLLMESRLFEEAFLEPMADQFVDLNRQFMTNEREIFILGANATTDPDTGAPIPTATRQMMNGWDLVPNYEAKATGATSQMNRSQRQQNITFLMQAASTNPMVAAAVNWIAFFRQAFREFEMDNVNELVATPQQMQAQMAQMQGGNKNDQQQSEVPGTPNGTSGPGQFANYAGQGVT